MLKKIGLFSFFAFCSDVSFQANHSTGFCACCKRYGLVSFARLFGVILLKIYIGYFYLIHIMCSYHLFISLEDALAFFKFIYADIDFSKQFYLGFVGFFVMTIVFFFN